ncbi:unnamed protein product [Amoebophrya sp. A25]|nr:unnamed protein product [Amoebophrya sp. A25]|eukprot:GSA25T00018754001.1
MKAAEKQRKRGAQDFKSLTFFSSPLEARCRVERCHRRRAPAPKKKDAAKMPSTSSKGRVLRWICRATWCLWLDHAVALRLVKYAFVRQEPSTTAKNVGSKTASEVDTPVVIIPRSSDQVPAAPPILEHAEKPPAIVPVDPRDGEDIPCKCLPAGVDENDAEMCAERGGEDKDSCETDLKCRQTCEIFPVHTTPLQWGPGYYEVVAADGIPLLSPSWTPDQSEQPPYEKQSLGGKYLLRMGDTFEAEDEVLKQNGEDVQRYLKIRSPCAAWVPVFDAMGGKPLIKRTLAKNTTIGRTPTNWVEPTSDPAEKETKVEHVFRDQAASAGEAPYVSNPMHSQGPNDLRNSEKLGGLSEDSKIPTVEEQIKQVYEAGTLDPTRAAPEVPVDVQKDALKSVGKAASSAGGPSAGSEVPPGSSSRTAGEAPGSSEQPGSGSSRSLSSSAEAVTEVEAATLTGGSAMVPAPKPAARASAEQLVRPEEDPGFVVGIVRKPPPEIVDINTPVFEGSVIAGSKAQEDEKEALVISPSTLSQTQTPVPEIVDVVCENVKCAVGFDCVRGFCEKPPNREKASCRLDPCYFAANNVNMKAHRTFSKSSAAPSPPFSSSTAQSTTTNAGSKGSNASATGSAQPAKKQPRALATRESRKQKMEECATLDETQCNETLGCKFFESDAPAWFRSKFGETVEPSFDCSGYPEMPE